MADALYICRDARPCRLAELEMAGYQLVVHESHDWLSKDFSKIPATILLLTGEPTVNAFLAYEESLKRKNLTHSVEHLQYWLAREAIKRIDLWRKYGPNSEVPTVIVKQEDLISSPRTSFESVFSAAGTHVVEGDMASVLFAVDDLLTAPQATFSTIEAEPHYVRAYFVEFMNLLAAEAEYYGYAPWQPAKAPSGSVTTLYHACRALDQKNYEEAVAVLTPFVGTNTVDMEVRAMLSNAMLEVGRELEGRRAMEIVLRMHPDYIDGYLLLADHAYELGLNTEGRAYLREAATRKGGPAEVGKFLHRLKPDPELAREFPLLTERTVDRAGVIAGFSWILGRLPESDRVIEDHQVLTDDDALRVALMRSQEFKALYERIEAGQVPTVSPEQQALVKRKDVLSALRWLLGRPLRTSEEAEDLLSTGSVGECRLRILRSEEFKRIFRELT